MNARSVNLALKAAFAALLLFVAIRHDLPRFQGKAIPLRLVIYPISALLVPVVWARSSAGRRRTRTTSMRCWPHRSRSISPGTRWTSSTR